MIARDEEDFDGLPHGYDVNHEMTKDEVEAARQLLDAQYPVARQYFMPPLLCFHATTTLCRHYLVPTLPFANTLSCDILLGASHRATSCPNPLSSHFS